MITLDRTPRTEVFPRWRSPIGHPGHTTVPRPRPVPESGTVRPNGFATLRERGWTIWFGRHTRQYWAAHTGHMRLVYADSAEELLGVVTTTSTASPRH